ncbi:aminopeptidase P N-terminal domain-containing protein [Fulvivirgaceae bacterium BMA12]|uniref:Xaa-Pro aminopeptidase n=1 Tax=Agaribacillus aureus TaxID=3051825 RepID=A0ABT8LFX7_9BACT|nr:aminopeptidase P N-terminal domain-containing protein [Fulvivirgaceae bacterium BMA12]
MKYLPIGAELFKLNRANLIKQLKPNSIAILNANDIMPTNADGIMPFRQNNDLFYLSGIDQEETILVLIPDFPEEKFREMLFIKETSELIAIWEGHKLTKEEATEISGLKSVFWTWEFEKMLPSLMASVQHIYLNTNEHTRAEINVETRDARFIKFCKAHYPLHHYNRLAPVMHDLRSVKSEREIAMLQKACDITAKGFQRILKFVKPGVMEYEIEAEYMHEFLRNRSRGFAYQPIIASGGNACVLHYLENNKACMAGDVLLMDVGAEYANYNADMTRAIPVNGRFTNRQKAVYNAVLKVKNEATKLLTPGNTLKDYNEEVGKIMESELIGLKLLDKTDVKNQDPGSPLFKKYFMHGTSHHLGLDVHDVSNMERPMQEGNVFTVEPGIYIPDENLGIRLEDDVVITKEGVFNLMGQIPIEADEIEEVMNS